MFRKTMMTLQHVNLRREGDQDAAETAVDLKLRGTVLAEVQDMLTGDRPLPLWDAQGSPTIPGLILDQADRVREPRILVDVYDNVEDPIRPWYWDDDDGEGEE